MPAAASEWLVDQTFLPAACGSAVGLRFPLNGTANGRAALAALDADAAAYRRFGIPWWPKVYGAIAEIRRTTGGRFRPQRAHPVDIRGCDRTTRPGRQRDASPVPAPTARLKEPAHSAAATRRTGLADWAPEADPAAGGGASHTITLRRRTCWDLIAEMITDEAPAWRFLDRQNAPVPAIFEDRQSVPLSGVKIRRTRSLRLAGNAQSSSVEIVESRSPRGLATLVEPETDIRQPDELVDRTRLVRDLWFWHAAAMTVHRALCHMPYHRDIGTVVTAEVGRTPRKFTVSQGPRTRRKASTTRGLAIANGRTSGSH